MKLHTMMRSKKLNSNADLLSYVSFLGDVLMFSEKLTYDNGVALVFDV